MYGNVPPAVLKRLRDSNNRHGVAWQGLVCGLVHTWVGGWFFTTGRVFTVPEWNLI